LSHGGLSYAYDGLGNRVSQDNGSVVTKYLLDTQPGLAVVLRESDSTNTNHFVHGLRGIHAQYDGSAWEYMMQDGLGSVRGMTDSAASVQQSINYSEYGEPDTSLTGFAFTGEQRDSNGLQYHRARYYDPVLGVWMSLDSKEGKACTPMSLNRYSWVQGNPINFGDVSGNEPTEFDVRNRRAVYSCQCGWLDTSHITWSVRAAGIHIRQALDLDNYTVQSPIPNNRGRIINLPGADGGLRAAVYNLWFYVPEALLASEEGKKSVALRLFMEWSVRHEEIQSNINAQVRIIRGLLGWLVQADKLSPPSGFSEEDLPSNLVGYYLYDTNPGGFDVNLPPSDVANLNSLRDLCGTMSIEQSALAYGVYDPFDYRGLGFTKNEDFRRIPVPDRIVELDQQGAFDPNGNSPICNSYSYPDNLEGLLGSAAPPPTVVQPQQLQNLVQNPNSGLSMLDLSSGLGIDNNIITPEAISNLTGVNIQPTNLVNDNVKVYVPKTC